MSENVGNCEKKYWKLWENIGKLWENIGNCDKLLEIVRKYWKFWENIGNCDKLFGNCEKILEIVRKYWNNIENSESKKNRSLCYLYTLHMKL